MEVGKDTNLKGLQQLPRGGEVNVLGKKALCRRIPWHQEVVVFEKKLFKVSLRKARPCFFTCYNFCWKSGFGFGVEEDLNPKVLIPLFFGTSCSNSSPKKKKHEATCLQSPDDLGTQKCDLELRWCVPQAAGRALLSSPYPTERNGRNNPDVNQKHAFLFTLLKLSLSCLPLLSP